MIRNDHKALEFVCNYQKSNYDWVADAYFNKSEDYGIDITLKTTDGRIYREEVKTVRSYTIKDVWGDYNDYFCINNFSGMFRKAYWKQVPDKSASFQDIQNIDLSTLNLPENTDNEIPEHLMGKYCYLLNASTYNPKAGLRLCPNSCKFFQMASRNNTILCVLASDGMLVWDYKMLSEAFLGYVWMKCKHTEDFACNDVLWELKAVFDIKKAKFVRCKVPQEIFEKN